MPQLDGAGSFISETGLDNRASAPTLRPWWSGNVAGPPLCFTPPEPQPLPTCESQTCPLLTLSQTPIKLIQPTQILAPLQPVALPTVSILPRRRRSLNQRNKSLNQINKSLNQNKNKNSYRKEFLAIYHADGTPDYGKASSYLESVIARLQRK